MSASIPSLYTVASSHSRNSRTMPEEPAIPSSAHAARMSSIASAASSAEARSAAERICKSACSSDSTGRPLDPRDPQLQLASPFVGLRSSASRSNESSVASAASARPCAMLPASAAMSDDMRRCISAAPSTSRGLGLAASGVSLAAAGECMGTALATPRAGCRRGSGCEGGEVPLGSTSGCSGSTMSVATRSCARSSILERSAKPRSGEIPTRFGTYSATSTLGLKVSRGERLVVELAEPSDSRRFFSSRSRLSSAARRANSLSSASPSSELPSSAEAARCASRASINARDGLRCQPRIWTVPLPSPRDSQPMAAPGSSTTSKATAGRSGERMQIVSHSPPGAARIRSRSLAGSPSGARAACVSRQHSLLHTPSPALTRTPTKRPIGRRSLLALPCPL
eukprot:scaffold287105_cov24-Tisochrysis_lutea.AAC.4